MNDVYATIEPARAEIDALEGPTVLEFGSPSCGYCRAAQPLLASAFIDHSRVLAVSRPSRSQLPARDHVILSEAKDLLTTRALTSLREPVTIVTIVRVLETKRKTGTDLFSLRTNAGRERRYSYVENKSFPIF